MKKMRALSLILALGLYPLASVNAADLMLANVFSDHAVLQRQAPVPIWGTANAGETIRISFAGQKLTTTTAADGQWIIKLQAMEASSESRELIVEAQGKQIKLSDLLVGEVWLASGQSNMGFPLSSSLQSEKDIAGASDAQLRFLQVPHQGAAEPQPQLPSCNWELASPTNAPKWSAVAYYYARNLREKLQIPVGIIQSSVGATCAESWTSRAVLTGDPLFTKVTEDSIKAWLRFPEDARNYPILLAEWTKKNQAEDTGPQGETQGFARPEFDDTAWREVTIPTPLRALGMKGGGVVWFRKTIEFPANVAAKNTWLGTNWSSDADQRLYFNGERLEPIGEYKPYYHASLRFKLPGKLIRPGQRNTVALRLHSLTPGCGFFQHTKNINLPVEDLKLLDAHWKFKIETPFPDLSPQAIKSLPKAPTAELLRNTHTSLFNAMIHPLIPYGIRGAIWYQGESNASRAQEYQHLLSLMIGDWRNRWGEGNFPFYQVQLANYGEPSEAPAESPIAALRDAQAQITRSVPNTDMAVAIDIGEVSIHPLNKREVGRRLALVSLAKTYQQDLAYSGPQVESHVIEGNSVRIRFSHLHGGLVGGPLKQFSIAGADGKFVGAEARVDGPCVVVSSPQVSQPRAVRYAWAGNPQGCNLYNQAGLPASPFHLDAGKTK